MNGEGFSWPSWARGAEPLFRALLGCCGGNCRVNYTEQGEPHKIEISIVLNRKNIEAVSQVAKRMGLP